MLKKLNELAATLRAANFSVSAGQIDDGRQRLRVQPVGEITRIDDLRALVLDARGLKLSDIAEVRLRSQEVDYGRRLDGRPATSADQLIDVKPGDLAILFDVRRYDPALLEVARTHARDSRKRPLTCTIH